MSGNLRLPIGILAVFLVAHEVYADENYTASDETERGASTTRYADKVRFGTCRKSAVRYLSGKFGTEMVARSTRMDRNLYKNCSLRLACN